MNKLDRTIHKIQNPQDELAMAFALSSKINATREIYPDLVAAYDRFNERLFAGMLPPALITLTRNKSTLGYFSPTRFVRHDGQITHEIAMNPAYFATRSHKDTLSTLVHEAVHLWQHVHGTPSRNGYHNAEWASMMRAVGLMPSATGQPGGSQVGERMDHYIIEGGVFDRACDELVAEGFRLSWVDRYPAEVPVGMDIDPTWRPPTEEDLAALVVAPPVKPLPPREAAAALLEAVSTGSAIKTQPVPVAKLPEPALAAVAGALSWPSDQRKSALKSKYRCNDCRLQLWGRSGAHVMCMDCNCMMSEVRDSGRRPARPRAARKA